MREFEEATRRARGELAGRDPAILAGRAAAAYSFPDRAFTLPCLGGAARVSFPGGEVTLDGGPAEGALPLIVLHYLLGAQALEPAGEWIAYRDLPGARYHEGAFRAEVEMPLARALQDRAEGMEAWVGEMGLERSGHGGISFVWSVLPRVPLLFILNPADEEFPAEARVFYDATAPSQLPTEDLEALAGIAARRITEAA